MTGMPRYFVQESNVGTIGVMIEIKIPSCNHLIQCVFIALF